MPVPLLMISDSVSAQTGLGRITRDLASRICANLSDTFRVATLGYGGAGSKSFPWQQYHIHSIADGWMIPELPEVWQDWAGGGEGIVMTIWDPSRLQWFSRPQHYCRNESLREYLMEAPFQRWGYFPIDAEGPQGKLSCSIRDCFYGYDRILLYSKWAEDVVRKTLDGLAYANLDIASLPHGIDTSVFYPRDHTQARKNFIGGRVPISDDTYLIGIVATNQARKDWGLAFETIALASKNMKIRVLIQTDSIGESGAGRYWHLPVLLEDFGIRQQAVVCLGSMTDEEMAWTYSACDLTLGIGLGEGFGYPIFESLACGTSCVHGAYGGAAEHLSPSFDPVRGFKHRWEGAYGNKRPVFDPEDWVHAIRHWASYERMGHSLLPGYLDWNNLWPRWEKWLKDGLTGALAVRKASELPERGAGSQLNRLGPPEEQ